MSKPTTNAIDPQLTEDIEISRRELAESKGIPHEVVFAQMDEMLRTLKTKQTKSKHRPKARAHIPNTETIAALEEADRIVNDPTRKTYDNLDEFWADLEK